MQGVHFRSWLRIVIAGFAIIGALASCSRNREVVLPGERLDPRDASLTAPANDAVETAEGLDPAVVDGDNRSLPFEMPGQVANAAWTHRNGSASHRIVHPALARTLTQAWSSDIGAGNGRKHVITADPVVSEGRVFAMDSRSQVVALAADSGRRLWSRDLTPGFDRNEDASGGGLAVAGNTLYATTGFGTLSALDVETGDVRWEQRLDGAVSGVPTIHGDLVYVVSRDGTAWAINAEDGRIRWSLPGIPSQSAVVGGPGAAVTDTIAVFPYSSGDLVASFPRGGVRLWAASLAGQRRGRVYAEVTDITGDPVIDGNVIYAGSSSGRLVALDTRGGARIWTVTEGAMSPVWPAGGSVFVVTDQSELLRLDAATGDRIWGAELPHFKRENPRRRETVYAHYGPVLAGGRLIVASSDGKLRSFDPVDGSELAAVDLRGGAASGVAVAGGTLYVVTDNGALNAFR